MSAEGIGSSETVRSTNYYYCHQCFTHFTLNSIPNDDSSAVCPRCQMGFIEELPDPPPSNTVNSAQDFLETINVLAGRPSGGGGNQDGGGAAAGAAPLAFIGFPNFMQELTDIFASFDGGRGGQQIHLIQPNPGGMTMHSNPGDYVFGGAGIDGIVTQILNQPLDGLGPPPLDKELIKKIPTVKISREQVDSNLQCSVCWEDFVIDEPVRELKCDHFFHEQCIIPWLELHGTCPVCRKFQQEEQSKEDGSPQSTNNENPSSSSENNTENNTWSSWTNATELNDVFTSAIDTVLRSVEFPSSSSASTVATGGNSSSSSSNGSGGGTSTGTNNERESSSNADISNYYFDFDLE